MRTLTEALLAAHEILEGAGVVHALCGGLAANLYRDEVRATADIDLAIAISPGRVLLLVQAFSADGWKAEPYWRRAEMIRFERPGFPRVDCPVASTDFERAAIERAVPATIEGREIRVLTPEDLIIEKLVAGRARDYEAVAAIINTLGTALDADYVKGWLGEFGFADAWGRALEEARRESGNSW